MPEKKTSTPKSAATQSVVKENPKSKPDNTAPLLSTSKPTVSQPKGSQPTVSQPPKFSQPSVAKRPVMTEADQKALTKANAQSKFGRGPKKKGPRNRF